MAPMCVSVPSLMTAPLGGAMGACPPLGLWYGEHSRFLEMPIMLPGCRGLPPIPTPCSGPPTRLKDVFYLSVILLGA